MANETESLKWSNYDYGKFALYSGKHCVATYRELDRSLTIDHIDTEMDLAKLLSSIRDVVDEAMFGGSMLGEGIVALPEEEPAPAKETKPKKSKAKKQAKP